MKIIGFVIPVISLVFSAYGQSRKEIIEQIRDYKYYTLNNAVYNTDLDSLKNRITQYFLQKEYEKIMEADSALTYYFGKRVWCISQGGAGRNPNDKRFNSIYSSPYVKTWVGLYVSVYISEEAPGKKVYVFPQSIRISLLYCLNSSEIISKYEFDELALRSALYEAFVGKYIPLPEELDKQINDHNAAQDNPEKMIFPEKVF